jgi:hypothetical protein
MLPVLYNSKYMHRIGKIPRLFTALALCLVFCSAAEAQESATVDVPDVIKAGEVLRFTITLDRAPNFDGGSVMFMVVGPNSSVQTSAGVVSGQLRASGAIQIPASATGGKWTIHIMSFFDGSRGFPLKAKDTPFTVIPLESLIVPSSAEVRVNPNQQQLLRKAALVLQTQIQGLKNDLAQHASASEQSSYKVVRGNVEEAMKALV